MLYVIDDMRIPWDISAVIFHAEENLGSWYHDPVWYANTHVPTGNAGVGAYCVMNDDGNFVVYDEDDKVRFQSGTKGNPGAFLRCQDDGNLVIYTRDNKAIWQSKTYAPWETRRDAVGSQRPLWRGTFQYASLKNRDQLAIRMPAAS